MTRLKPPILLYSKIFADKKLGIKKKNDVKQNPLDLQQKAFPKKNMLEISKIVIKFNL